MDQRCDKFSEMVHRKTSQIFNKTLKFLNFAQMPFFKQQRRSDFSADQFSVASNETATKFQQTYSNFLRKRAVGKFLDASKLMGPSGVTSFFGTLMLHPAVSFCCNFSKFWLEASSKPMILVYNTFAQLERLIPQLKEDSSKFWMRLSIEIETV